MSDPAPPAVSVVVPVRNGAATLPALLDALAAQDLDLPWELLVVDNGSRDDTPELVRRHPVGARLLHESQVGSYAARNAGIAEAAAPVLAFTDADCVPEPGWLSAGLAALDGCDLVGGDIVPIASARPTLWERYDRLPEPAGLRRAPPLRRHRQPLRPGAGLRGRRPVRRLAALERRQGAVPPGGGRRVRHPLRAPGRRRPPPPHHVPGDVEAAPAAGGRLHRPRAPGPHRRAAHGRAGTGTLGERRAPALGSASPAGPGPRRPPHGDGGGPANRPLALGQPGTPR
jgi:hypothetical protein